MNFFASILVTIIFLSFSIAVKKHFSSKTTPRGMILISALSIIGFSWIQWSIFYEKPNDTILFLVCLLTFLSGCLFFSAIRQTARSDLKLAFDNNIPDIIITNGTYQWVRHPFYTSYLMLWLNLLLLNFGIISSIIFVLLFLTYNNAAQCEEESFMKSELSEYYQRYKIRTGRFIPKIW